MPILSELSQSQQFDWGAIRWMVEPGKSGVERVSACLITFYARTVQEEHLHIGYEQILYIVSGHGHHEVNGEGADLIPGTLVHIPPFARHSLRNDTDDPLTLVSLYFPLRSQHVAEVQEINAGGDVANQSIWSFLDMEALGILFEKLSQALGFRLSLMDAKGNSIINSSNRPAFCTLLRNADKGRHCRSRVREAIRESYPHGKTDKADNARSTLFICCNSIASILIPVYSNKKIAGYIKCGEAFLSQADRDTMSASLCESAGRAGISPESLLEAAKDVRMELKSVLYAAAEATLTIANYITEMAASAIRRKELDKSRLSLAQEQMATAKLQQELREADFKLLQSQINPHFLFNTLSTVAQMAYMGEGKQVAKVIWSLSDLLRFTLRHTDELIPLREELKLLNDYILIQQARFEERLHVTWDIEPGLEGVLIPCMVLQPLVENAIIHGLEPLVKPGRIRVSARKEGCLVRLAVHDNGVGFSPQAMKEKQGHIGIASVQHRLQYYFTDASSFAIESKPGKGTTITIRLPFSGVAAGIAAVETHEGNG